MVPHGMQYNRNPLTDKVSYDNLVELPDFNRIYTVAIEKAGIWKKLETLDSQGILNQPLKILDMGGGIGTLGRLFESEFGPYLEYVNVDIDSESLIKSPGKSVHGSYTNLHKLLGEEEFDYVFCLNLEDRTKLNQHTIENMRRDGQEDEFLGTDLVSMYIAADYNCRQINGYLVLLNAALVVTHGGMFIRGGVIPKDALNGTKDELAKLGFQSFEDEQLALSMETGRIMLDYDLQFAGKTLSPSQLEKFAQTYVQNFRLTTFGKKGRKNKEKTRNKITEASNRLSELYLFIETQERFWG